MREPVAWMNKHGACMSPVLKEVDLTGGEYTIPLYTTPPQRTWVGLTKHEHDEILITSFSKVHHAIKLTQDKLKEKNT